MTNKEFMCTLSTDLFEATMHTLYFKPKLWVKGNYVKKCSTPTMFDIQEWLDNTYDPNTDFWKYILTDEDAE